MRRRGYRSARCGCSKQVPLCPAEGQPRAWPVWENAHCGTSSVLGTEWGLLLKTVGDGMNSQTLIVLTFMIMEIQVDKWGWFLPRIRDHYLHFTVMHTSWFCCYWFVVPGYSETAKICFTACQSYWWLLVKKLCLKVRGRWVSCSPQSWHLQPCSPE